MEIEVWYTAKEIIDLAKQWSEHNGADDLWDLLLEVAGDRGHVSTRRLGRWLQSRAGRIVDGKRLVTKDGRGGIARYLVEMV